MPPNQPQGESTPSLPVPNPPTPPVVPGPQPSPEPGPTGGMKVIQPVSQPDAEPANSPAGASPAPAGAIYPNPVSPPSPVLLSKSDIEAQEHRQRRHHRFIVLAVCAAVVVLAGAGGFLYWYAKQDHSIFSKLTAKSYNQNGVVFSFQYPKILTVNASLKNKNVLAAYTYSSRPDAQYVQITAAYLDNGSTLDDTGVTPAQAMAQIKQGSGRFVSALKQPPDPNLFNELFGGCNQYIMTIGGQKALLCERTVDGEYDVRVIGLTATHLYSFALVMKKPVWQAHQQIWRKVEKSFQYQ